MKNLGWSCGLAILLASVSTHAQFTSFRQGPVSIGSGSLGTTFNTGREFSNFVDLPSQRFQANSRPSVQQSARLQAQPSRGLGGDCALPLPNGGQCITYQEVDEAFITAKDRVVYARLQSPGPRNPTTVEIDRIATVIQETTRILAERYNMDFDLINEGLSKIDTKQTVIPRYCPEKLIKTKCEVKRYRELNGKCNNLDNPYWGGSMMATSRFLPYGYADGISKPRVAHSGNSLPSTRLISRTVHRDENVHEHSISILLVAWGQFIDHDIVLTADTRDVNCCKGANVTHPLCFPIEIPSPDPFYGQHGQSCISVVRNRGGLRAECKLGPREQFNEVTSVLDANPVYSSDEKVTDSLRTYQGGLMKTLPAFQNLGLKDLMPLNLDDPERMCIRPHNGVYCFLGGDPRTSEQGVLAAIHTIFLREHNRIATELAYINPHWSDEILFQETRHIIAAMMQHITYNEFLPLVLGKVGLKEHDLTLYSHGYFDKYDPTVNPGAASEFTTAAFRFGHSLLPSTVERWSMSHKYVGTQKLSSMLMQPYDLYKPGWMDQYLMGLVNQVAQAMDDSVTSQVTNHLFEKPRERFGMDLAAINMQRGRDHGIQSYNRYREWCGLHRVVSWHDLEGVFINNTIQHYSRLYETPEDIDLWSGGVSEIPRDGALIGPTFSCIVGRQFHNLRIGDRFWYENSGWPSSFTTEQLQEIRKVTLARILCDNSDGIESIQKIAMLLTDHKINPRVSCRSLEIPRIELSYWQDYSPSV